MRQVQILRLIAMVKIHTPKNWPSCYFTNTNGNEDVKYHPGNIINLLRYVFGLDHHLDDDRNIIEAILLAVFNTLNRQGCLSQTVIPNHTLYRFTYFNELIVEIPQESYLCPIRKDFYRTYLVWNYTICKSCHRYTAK